VKKTALIIGFGSIGKQQYQVLKKLKIFQKIYIYSKRNKKKNFISEFNKIVNINPDFIIICSETAKHFSQLKFIESKFKNKIILVEKPLFSSSKYLSIKNNKVFVGYNLRYDPMLQYIKKIIEKEKKIITSNITCNSFLPNWRIRDYSKSYSASKRKGGGVHLDLSHEIDYTNWIFKNLKKINAFSEKISNLKINTIDYFNWIGKSKYSKIINIKLSYFSIKDQRTIEVLSYKNYILVDLLNRVIEFSNLKNTKIKKFKKLNSLQRIELQIKDIISKKPIYACTYKEAYETLKIIGV
tara:strand:- start:341 stop:1231 length:891 start_codon:yes stop_codon:yes gene_type:complete